MNTGGFLNIDLTMVARAQRRRRSESQESPALETDGGGLGLPKESMPLYWVVPRRALDQNEKNPPFLIYC